MEVSENEYKAFIGKKADYYIEKWTEMEKRHTKTSWSWGAFLFGLLWMLYRKMYFYTLIAVSILCGIGIMESFLGIGGVFDVILSFIFCLLFGIFGNYLYRRYTENKILRIKRECKEQYPRHQPILILPIFVIRQPISWIKIGSGFCGSNFNVSRTYLLHIKYVLKF